MSFILHLRVTRFFSTKAWLLLAYGHDGLVCQYTHRSLSGNVCGVLHPQFLMGIQRDVVHCQVSAILSMLKYGPLYPIDEKIIRRLLPQRAIARIFFPKRPELLEFLPKSSVLQGVPSYLVRCVLLIRSQNTREICLHSMRNEIHSYRDIYRLPRRIHLHQMNHHWRRLPQP